MLEMATSAGHCMLSVRSPETATTKSSAASLLDISIPSPLVLSASHESGTLLSVSLDTASSTIRVHSKKDRNQFQSSHLIGHLAATQIRAAIHIIDMNIVPWVWASPNSHDMQPQAAVAVVEHSTMGQSGQYSIHPAVLDNCTQVFKPDPCAHHVARVLILIHCQRLPMCINDCIL
jgi:hypothetical protein